MLAAPGLIKGYVYVMSLFGLEHRGEALDAAALFIKEGNRVAPLVAAGLALIEGRRSDSLAAIDEVLNTMSDPEGVYYSARQCAYLEDAVPARQQGKGRKRCLLDCAEGAIVA